MLEMRRFEEKVSALFVQNLIKSSIHLALGHEAIAAGVAAAMLPDDYTFCTYRGHAHTLARGTPMDAVMAELLGRAGGICAGKGGSMHLTSIEHGVMGSNAIIGAHIPIAVGAAWSSQARRSGQVTVCFFGDGATNIGAFHEGLNLAAVWRLPIVFVCENNFYMEYTPIREMTAVEHPAADRAVAYSMPAEVIDGNDVEVVYERAAAAIEAARSGEGPRLIEAHTYRWGGHSRGEPGNYRPAEEVAYWKDERDPLKLQRDRLLSAGVAEERFVEIDREVEAAVAEAADFAIAADWPRPERVEADLWADGGAQWRS
jgi:acetoin:2,6-dichlorophenolindophenol oxidoreductase subunit alpha